MRWGRVPTDAVTSSYVTSSYKEVKQDASEDDREVALDLPVGRHARFGAPGRERALEAQPLTTSGRRADRRGSMRFRKVADVLGWLALPATALEESWKPA
jgi:hypothetical protein